MYRLIVAYQVQQLVHPQIDHVHNCYCARGYYRATSYVFTCTRYCTRDNCQANACPTLLREKRLAKSALF